VHRNFLVLGIGFLSLAGALLAQNPPAKTAPKKSTKSASGSVAQGKDIFAKKCSTCHYADSGAKKIGPGLKGLSKRGTFSVNNNKITDESLKAWIDNGDTLMPPFQDVLDEAQVKDVIAYVKTL
jgi:mono/diheme cytochrome c family protein